MHRAFQLDEIISLIATQVAATKCADVVRLTHACRTLAKLSLGTLWSKHQNEFLPLTMWLPHGCFVLDDDGFESLYVTGVFYDWRILIRRFFYSTSNALRNHTNGSVLIGMYELCEILRSRGRGQVIWHSLPGLPSATFDPTTPSSLTFVP